MADANQLLLLAVAIGLLHVVVFALVMRWSEAANGSPEDDGLSSLSDRDGDVGRNSDVGGDGAGRGERTDQTSRSVTGEPAGPSLDTDEPTVRCPACGAENEAAYQYCRLCVSELHGGAAGVVADGSNASQRDRLDR